MFQKNANSILFNMKLIKCAALLFLLAVSTAYKTNKETIKHTTKESTEPIKAIQDKNLWADSVFKTLSPDERISQLFMVAAYSNRDHKHENEILKLVTEQKIGGLIFFQGGPVRQANLTNLYQSKSKVPLMISIDGEWGLAMRLDSTVQFPRQMTLGAIQDDKLIYDMGAEIAKQCKRMGIHVNFAPVADINNNPANPVIGNRSFGEDKFKVTQKCIAYMRGMQDNGILANAKHFPGHGDTDSDTHKTMPIVNHSKERLDSLELYPFKELIKNGIGSMMVAHLSIPALDTAKINPSTLSKAVVTDLLKKDLGFEGLIFTDALNMKGVSKFYPPGIVDVKALLAGNDVLLFAENIPLAISEIKKAIEAGEITQQEIDSRCLKILKAKQWGGLDNYSPIKTKNLYEDLNNTNSELINRKLAQESLTLLSNKNELIPLKKLDTLKIAALSIGYKEENTFQKTLGLYAKVDNYGIDRDANLETLYEIEKKLLDYNLIIINVNNTNNSPSKNFGIKPLTMDLINTLRLKTKVIVSIFGNPYLLGKMAGIEKVDGLIMAYEENEYTQSLAAQLIFGGISAKGKLPISIAPNFSIGQGLATNKMRFKYTIPEEINIDSKYLSKIDSIAMYGISQKAYPGCQILVAKAGNVIYQKSFGKHTYEGNQKVKNSDLYDLASVTKISASLLAVMKLENEGKLKLDDKLTSHLPQLENTNKKNISIRDLLAHQAGLKDWIPFYNQTINKGQYKDGYYNKEQNERFPYRVADNLYLRNDYKDSILEKIIESPLNTKLEYKYSDLGYYFLKEIIETEKKESLDRYVSKNFYVPMGMTTTTYKPREKFDLKQIVPTENDMTFRKQLIHGDVHDQGSAMLGGVGGHAGLFSNANDLAKLMQMYMQYGEYGGERYLSKEILTECIKCQFCENDNRRGVGFDKPQMDYSKEGPTCKCVSYMSFGHTGFTGTMAWADPETEIVYIFLSNRVYPDAENKKLTSLGIRSKIQQVIYDSLEK